MKFSKFFSMSIKRRLYLSFACMLGIMIFFAVFRGAQLDTVMGRYNNAMTTITVRQQYIGEIVTSFNRVRIDTLRVSSLFGHPNFEEQVRRILLDRDSYVQTFRVNIEFYRDHVAGDYLLTQSEKQAHYDVLNDIILTFEQHYIPAVYAVDTALVAGHWEDVLDAMAVTLPIGDYIADNVWLLRDKSFAFAMDVADIMQQQDRVEEMIFNIATIVGIAIAILLALLLSYAVRTPIFQLTKSAEEAADLSVESKIFGLERADEIGELARTVQLMRESLEVALYDARASSRAKSNFLATMSHEIRTPINAIVGMSTIGKQAGTIQSKDYSFGKIEEASSYLLGIINDVLDLSKMEADKLSLVCEPLSLAQTLQKVMAVNQFRMEEKQVRFSVDVAQNIPEVMLGDDQRLAQVLINLLSNAVKFTPQGKEIRMTASLLSSTSSECVLQFEVIDQGVGISPQQQTQLFKPFLQAEISTAREFGGTGLGLAISKHIVELMGGRIWVKSSLGQGSCFSFTARFTLPCSQKNIPIAQDAPVPESEVDFTDKCLLLAEDIELNREIVIALLEPVGFRIECAENGAQAFAMFEQEPKKYDFIFMDVNMPTLDGYESTRQIRALQAPWAKQVPIVAMTANVFPEDVEKCLDAGMNAHLGKPLDFAAVTEVLRRYLGKQESPR